MSYFLEYAKSDNSTCRGPQDGCPSVDRRIDKGELRLGTQAPFLHGHQWKHWICVSPLVIEHMHQAYSDPSEIPGFDEIRKVDQQRVRKAWEEGDIPDDEKPEPAPEHINPRAKNKPSGELPATNEEAAAAKSGSSGRGRKKGTISKGKQVKQEEEESAQEDQVEEDLEDEAAAKDDNADENEAAAKDDNADERQEEEDEEDEKPVKTKKATTTAKKCSSTAAKGKTPKKSRGQRTRCSTRIQSSSNAANKRTAETVGNGSKKAKNN